MIRSHRLPAAALVVTLALAACQPPATTSSPAAPSTPTNPSPSAAAAASPAPDVAALLRAHLASITSAEQRLSGVVRIGDVQVTFEGTQVVNGPDSTSALATTVGGVVTREERAKVAGTRYVKRGDGPWLEDSSTPGTSNLSAALEASVDALVDLDAGVTGAAPHRLSAAIPSFDPGRYGFAPSSDATPGTGTVTFSTKADGTPLLVNITGTWNAPSGSATADGSLELEVEFTKINNARRIAAPADVWQRFVSKRYGFTHAHPSDFDHARTKDYELFWGPTNAAGDVASTRTQTDGYDLNALVDAEVATWKRDVDASVSDEPVQLGGERGRLLSIQATDANLGGRVAIYEVVAVHRDHLYIVMWFGPRDQATAALPVFRQLLATFAFTD